MTWLALEAERTVLTPTIDLSIIVPLLDEADTLPGLLANLALQQGLRSELLLCDGGSSDGTRELADAAAQASGGRVVLVSAPRGRGRQLNAGAVRARGRWLLFLHADSDFADPGALRAALEALWEATRRRGDLKVAGHFPLRFRRENDAPHFGYFYYAAKSRLDLADCIHGDQGLLLHRDFFAALGPFDESLPFLEDADYADRIHAAGAWLLLPGEVGTSARRFEREGLRERQILNALIMNFRALGWGPFFAALPDLYRAHDRTRRLELLPVWRSVRALLAREPWRERLRLWQRTGAYVRPQAWQLWFAWRCYRCWRRSVPVTLDGGRVRRALRSFEVLTDNPPGRALATLLVWLWFQMTWLSLCLNAPPSPGEEPHD